MPRRRDSGAQRRDIVALVLRQAVWIVACGIFVGFAAALAGVPFLSTFLYGIRPHDAVTFGAVAVVIVAVATIACLVPAQRAARVDPLTAVRSGR